MRLACVLASDAAFFHQTRLCIDTIEAARPALADTELDIAVVGIDLGADQIAYLDERRIIRHDRLGDFPKLNGAPRHAIALTCRPYMPQFLPGYDGYIWVDSDIRFLTAGGLSYYVNALRAPSASVVIVQETEPCYCVNTNVKTTHIYHSAFVRRLGAVYGNDVAEYCRYFTQYNAGLFAAPANSPIWVRYRRNLDRAMRVPFDNMLEQDAMNVSIMEVGGQIRAPSSQNWLCSLALPAKRTDGAWCNPENPSETIQVAHLTNSTMPIAGAVPATTYYDLYQRIGLTA